MNLKKCVYCGTELRIVNSIHKEFDGSIAIAINNTPVLFCDGCLQEYISADVMEKIKLIIKKLDKKDNNIIVDFNDSI